MFNSGKALIKINTGGSYGLYLLTSLHFSHISPLTFSFFMYACMHASVSFYIYSVLNANNAFNVIYYSKYKK